MRRDEDIIAVLKITCKIVLIKLEGENEKGDNLWRASKLMRNLFCPCH